MSDKTEGHEVTRDETSVDLQIGNDGIAIVVFDSPGKAVNTMDHEFRAALTTVIDTLEEQHDSIVGVVLTSAKRTFFAGADLEELLAVDTLGAFELAEDFKAELRRLERFGRPVVAAIAGAALGGGLEIALAAHHRIAVDDAYKLGLPEVTLGLLPGGGGLTRLVRMMGLFPALDRFLLTGATFGPAEACEAGLVDAVVADRSELMDAARAWIRSHPQASAPWDARGYSVPGDGMGTASIAPRLALLPAQIRATSQGAAAAEAPLAIAAAAVEGLAVDFDTASRIESTYFARLATSRTARSIVKSQFVDLNALKSGRLRPDGFKPRPTSRLGVVGAGMMGAGIAYVAAQSEITVTLVDVTLEGAEKGKDDGRRLVAKKVERGRMTETEGERLLSRIKTADTVRHLADCDAVVEAVFEDPDLKARVFADIVAVVGPETLICSNTSTLPISDLAASVPRPGCFVGTHFFSPVDRMQLVEIIRGVETTDATVARALDLVQQLRKTAIVVRDGRGFYTSRVYLSLLDEAAALVGEGVDPYTIERAALAAGFAAPPLAMLDEVTLTLPRSIRNAAAEAAAAEGTSLDPRPGDVVLAAMIDDFKRPGRSGGGGFYDYPQDGPKVLWPGLWEQFGGSTDIRIEDVKDRLLFRMVLETVRAFEEGVIDSAAAANIGSMLGIGFPRVYGGAVQFIEGYPGGLNSFVGRAEELSAIYGSRFRAPSYLSELTDRMAGFPA